MKTTIQRFKLDKEYITSVPETKNIDLTFSDGKTISGQSYTTIDHPKFTELREKLEKEGYIQIERNWWNGDRVFIPFILNTMKFEVGDTFSCATALSIKMEIVSDRRKKNRLL